MPSKTLLTAIILSVATTVVITTIGVPGLRAVPLTMTFSVMAYFAGFSFIVNDQAKLVLVQKAGIRW